MTAASRTPAARRRRAPATTHPARSEPRLPLWSRPGYLVRRLNQIHYALFFEECREFRVTPVQYGLLTALFIRGRLDQVSLAEELGIDRTNVAEVLKRLSARGLVRREENPADRRARLASLTPKGKTLTSSMFGAMQRAQDRFLAPLSQVERDAFMATLVRLIEANNAYGRAIMKTD